MSTNTSTLVSSAASSPTPIAHDHQSLPMPGRARGRADRILRRAQAAVVALVAAVCMLVLTAPAPAQAMTTQARAVCSSFGDGPAAGINVFFPRITLSAGEAVWLKVYAYTADGHVYESNWAYAQGDSDWSTPGPYGQMVPVGSRRYGTGAALSLPAADLSFQAVVWLYPHSANDVSSGAWEYHYAVNAATGSTWCNS
jgi:hypothetical protein